MGLIETTIPLIVAQQLIHIVLELGTAMSALVFSTFVNDIKEFSQECC